MADPVGLASLALTGVGKATTLSRLHKKHKKVVKALAAQVDAADLRIRHAGAAEAESCRAVLSPLLDEATVLLQRFSARRPLQALTDAMDEVPEDIDAAKKLIDAFKAADGEIELRVNMLRIHDSVGAGSEATVAKIHMLQSDIARLEKTVQRCMVSVIFFRGGESGVTLHTSQKLLEFA